MNEPLQRQNETIERTYRKRVSLQKWLKKYERLTDFLSNFVPDNFLIELPPLQVEPQALWGGYRLSDELMRDETYFGIKFDALAQVIEFGLAQGYLCSKDKLFTIEQMKEVLSDEEIYHDFLIHIADFLSPEQKDKLKVARSELGVSPATPEKKEGQLGLTEFRFEALPEDLQRRIFSYLPSDDQVSLRSAQKALHEKHLISGWNQSWNRLDYLQLIGENRAKFDQLPSEEKAFYIEAANGPQQSGLADKENRALILYDWVMSRPDGPLPQEYIGEILAPFDVFFYYKNLKLKKEEVI
jgi:hypothetical protein